MNSIVISLTTRDHLGRTDRLFFSQKIIFACSSAQKGKKLVASALWLWTQQGAPELGPALSQPPPPPPPPASHLHLVSPPFIDTLSHQSARRTTQTWIPPSPPCPERRVPKQRHLARHRPLDSVLPIRPPVIYPPPPIGSTHGELKGLTNYCTHHGQQHIGILATQTFATPRAPPPSVRTLISQRPPEQPLPPLLPLR